MSTKTAKLTESDCPCCNECHPASQGVTVFTLEYECEDCGNIWNDTWCSIVDDDCPDCGVSYSPEVIDENVIEEEVD